MTENNTSKQSETEGMRCANTYRDAILKPRYDAVKRLFWCYLSRVDYAYAVMMAEQGLLTTEEVGQILSALRRLEQEIDQSLLSEPARDFEQGQDFISDSRDRFLSLSSPEIGEKLYRFRNYNEILHTMFNMALKDRLGILVGAVLSVLDGVLMCAKRDAAIIIPADAAGLSSEPTFWGAYLSGIADLLLRDCERVTLSLRCIDISPLGASVDRDIRLNRSRLSDLLGFKQTQDSTLSEALMDDSYQAIYETLKLLFFNISKITEGLIQRINSRVPHVWWPEESGAMNDILEELHLISLIAGNDASSFTQTTQNYTTPRQKNAYFTLQMRGYHVFDTGIRALKLLDNAIRTLKGDDRAFLRKIDREALVLPVFSEILARDEQLTPESSRQIVKRLALYLSEHRLFATQVPFSVFQSVFQEETERETTMTEDEFKSLLSPFVFLNANGMMRHFPVTLEPVLGRYEKMSFDLRAQLDVFMNRAQHADQLLAKAVDDFIATD